MDALQIVCGIWHGGRRDKVSLPVKFSAFRENGSRIVFVLVIKNCDKEDLLFAKEAILRQLLKENRLWQFEVLVLNEELAQKKNLVQ